MTGHDLSRTTHTPELQQLRELNEQLTAARAAGRPVTALVLGLTGQSVEGAGAAASPDGLPAAAILDRLSAQGPPDFPYVAGLFRAATDGPQTPELQVSLHTAALRRLSHHFGLHHTWGA
jgi:hypothetical protein